MVKPFLGARFPLRQIVLGACVYALTKSFQPYGWRALDSRLSRGIEPMRRMGWYGDCSTKSHTPTRKKRAQMWI